MLLNASSNRSRRKFLTLCACGAGCRSRRVADLLVAVKKLREAAAANRPDDRAEVVKFLFGDLAQAAQKVDDGMTMLADVGEDNVKQSVLRGAEDFQNA